MKRVCKLTLKTRLNGRQSEETLDLDDVKKYFTPESTVLIAIEGQVVRTYDELLAVAARHRNNDTDHLEILILDPGMLSGG